jgi:hypothetical protein
MFLAEKNEKRQEISCLFYKKICLLSKVYWAIVKKKEKIKFLAGFKTINGKKSTKLVYW